mmetsp:Transcript_48990/g.49754  ORF Transcript_48990/g.49754 Transcript_48990/m.49754 type:complete len:88 (+) Transcript_48990:232-495(+)
MASIGVEAMRMMTSSCSGIDVDIEDSSKNSNSKSTSTSTMNSSRKGATRTVLPVLEFQLLNLHVRRYHQQRLLLLSLPPRCHFVEER